jgi:dihydrofolate reductase
MKEFQPLLPSKRTDIMEHSIQIILIAAMTRSGVIGQNNTIPWHYSEDFKHFKRTTLGFPIVMGRKTFESLNQKPLPGRLNIVMSRDLNYNNHITQHDSELSELSESLKICSDPEQVLKIIHTQNPVPKKIFIIGGAQIYKLFLPMATECLISEIQTDYPGDCYFPITDWSDWTRESLESYPGFKICRFSKKL